MADNFRGQFLPFGFRYHAREYDQALDVIRQIDLLPLNVVPGSSQREFIQQKVMVSRDMKREPKSTDRPGIRDG